MGHFLMYGGKAFCEHPFVLHLQQPEKDKQNVNCAHPWKNFCGRHGYMVYFHESLLISAARPTRHGELTHKTKYDTCVTSTH